MARSLIRPFPSCALLARYHARRALAAVHCNRFGRRPRLVELFPATDGERDAVVVWRQLVANHGTHSLAAEWRAALKQLVWSLKEPAARLAAGRG